MKEENTNLESELKLNYSLKEALWLHKFEVIVNLVVIAICVYYINDNKENPELLAIFWVPFLVILIFELFAEIYCVFSLTRSNKTHLFVALFPLQLLRHAVRIGWFGYLNALYIYALAVSVADISEPYWVFAIFIFSYIIVDSSMVFLLLISILAKAKPVTNFLCKYWFIRDAFLLIVSYMIFCFFVYRLVSGRAAPVNIIFFVLTLIQSILISIYMKKKYCKPQTWEPKPLEAKLPERKMLKDTVSLISAMEEEKKEAAGAA